MKPTNTMLTPGATRAITMARTMGAALLLLVGVSCAKGDVGAPCNHGQVEPPESKLVTFPALTCNELLCVYADTAEAPKDPCTDNAICNQADPGTAKFECVKATADATSGSCRLSNKYVLERSMCSKKCSSDADCKDGGPTKKVVVENTNCQSGFKCARIQSLGEFCCAKLCVCQDDLAFDAELDQKCQNGMQEGCCDQAMKPEACGGA